MIFIGGTGRSGTTALAMAFQKDPRFAVFIEPRFIVFPGGLMDYVVSKSITRGEFIENMEDNFLPQMVRHIEGHQILPNGKAVYNAKLVRQTDYTAGRFTRLRAEYARLFTIGLLGEIHKHLGSRRIVYKQPHIIVWAGYLQWIYPTSKFIHIIRDPRDVCSSILERKWGPRTVDAFPAYYNKLLDDAFGAKLMVPYNRYIVVSLEALIAEPEQMMQRLYLFVGEKGPFRKVTKQMTEWISPDLGHIGRYADDLTTKQAQFIQAECGENYQRWLDLSMR